MFVGVLIVVLIVAGVLLASALRFGPVKRDRVERFAERGALPITPGNGNLVIRYLGLTRRWRALGLMTGFAASIAWSLRREEGRINFDLLLGFAGWFIGAVIAEYEFSVSDPRQERTASLQPRLLRDRLSRPAVFWPLLIVALALGCAGVLLLAGILRGGVEMWLVAGYLVLTAPAIGIPALVGRHVLDRAQPLSLTPDARDADNALRHRSLHVLAGCAVALTSYPAGGLAAMAADRFAGSRQAPSEPSTAVTFVADIGPSPIGIGFFVLAVALFLAPVIGWLVARTRRTSERVEMAVPR